jgi:hypothetical protein
MRKRTNCRRSFFREVLESRCLLNAAPVGVADEYDIDMDAVLVADRPAGLESYVTDFNDGDLGPHLEGEGFVVQDGVVRRQGAANHNDRMYLRTTQTGFLDLDFRYEISLTTSIVDKDAIYFVGIGSGRGEASNNEPSDSVHLAILGPNTADSRVDVQSHPAGHPTTTIGFLREPGTHRLRLEKIGNSLSFFIDEHFEGEFAADISFTVDDLAAAAPTLTDASTHLFFGTGIEEDYFDDLSVEYLTPRGLLANDTDADGDALTAELVSGPTHGSLVLLDDGTFTYTPAPGFVGADTFTYRALDGEAASDPTAVTVNVASTNVAPVAVADAYSVLQGQVLRATRDPESQSVSHRVFFTDFDAGVPAEFTGTTTLAEVQGYAGIGTGQNVFGGRMLRNQTGMAFPFQDVPQSPVIPTRLVLTDLPDHESVDIRFLLAAIDSWDGNTPLPDILAMTMDGQLVFVDTLDETSLADQSYVPPAGVLLTHDEDLGFNPLFGDAAYDLGGEPRLRNIPHTSDSITIEWFTYGQGWTAAYYEDESWGIDNVEVLVNSTTRLSRGVLTNDSDPDGESLTAIVESPPKHGSLSLMEDGSFEYTPDEGFAGIDWFTYRTNDGMADSEPAWVTIEVRPDARPVIAVDDEYDVTAGQPLVAGARSVIRDISTGFGEVVGEKLRDLAGDLDYTVVASPGDLYTGQTATVMPGDQPIGGYLPDTGSERSRWIGILRNLPDDFSVEPGDYIFEATAVIAPDIAANAAFIEGLRLAADNAVMSLLVNNVPVLTRTVVGFDTLTDMGDVGLGAFHPGVNVLQFVVHNDSGGRNPLGLRVEGRVVGQAAGENVLPGVLANDFLSPFSAVAGQVVSVGGTSDLWLAGMPAGTQASFGDVAPAHSPVLVPSLSFDAGDVLRFDATGNVGNTHNLQAFPTTDPDGGIFLQHESGAEHGLSNVIAPLNSLVGVFLGPSQPNFFAPPPTLDFRVGGNVPGGINYTQLAPQLQQVFFIGNGFTASRAQQEVVVPQGATRLFLGTMDGFRWADNIGRFDVQVLGGEGDQTGAALVETPTNGQVELQADGFFRYTPNEGFVGIDSFTYEVRNSEGDSDVATVVLHVARLQLPGDFSGNGLVEQADLDLVLGNWGRSAMLPPDGWINDLPTGTIDQNELDKVLTNWGATLIAAVQIAPSQLPVHETLIGPGRPAREVERTHEAGMSRRDRSEECLGPTELAAARKTLLRTILLDVVFGELSDERSGTLPTKRNAGSRDSIPKIERGDVEKVVIRGTAGAKDSHERDENVGSAIGSWPNVVSRDVAVPERSWRIR